MDVPLEIGLIQKCIQFAPDIAINLCSCVLESPQIIFIDLVCRMKNVSSRKAFNQCSLVTAYVEYWGQEPNDAKLTSSPAQCATRRTKYEWHLLHDMVAFANVPLIHRDGIYPEKSTL
jgi:hypothetical protein